MYFSNIGDSELLPFHNSVSTDFSISLTDLLVSDLFKVEQITNSIYRVYPLFYCNIVNSSNPNDKILDNRCLILQKREHETYLSFLNSEHENNIVFNEDIVKSYDIDDKLSVDEFNDVVYRLRKNNSFHEVLDFNEENIYLDDDILPSLSLNPILNSNKLENMQLKGVILNKKDNTPLKNKTFHIYYKTDENNWKFIKSINTNDTGEYSYIDYGLNDYIDNTQIGSRDELAELINTAITNDETVISLDKQYKFQSGDTYITIPSSITIEGNGHIIDANRKSRVFNITGDNVTLNNLILKNGDILADGGGILWTGNNGLLSNTIICDCICNDNGGGVYWVAEKAYISNVKFINNATNGKGGGLYFKDGVINIDGFVSFNNYSNDTGGCMFIKGDNCIVKNVIIRNDTSNGENPSILQVNGNNSVILNISVNSVYFQQNRVDRTNRAFNNGFEYKLVPSTWIDERDDYIVINRFNMINMSSSSSKGDIIDVVTFKGLYGDFKVYNLDNQLKNNNGVIINDGVKNNPLKVKLINNTFKHANYNLTGSVSSISDINITDIINNNITITSVNILLEPNTAIEIPLNDFENDSTLSNLVNVDIDFKVHEIRYTPKIRLSASTDTVFVDENIVLTAKYTDSENNPVIGVIIVFKDGNTVIGQSYTNNEGIATLTYNTNVVGSHTVIAESNGINSENIVFDVVDFDSIILSSDKFILSYANEEIATLTAQLQYSGVDVSVEGVSVSFEVYDSSDTLVETLAGATDNTGKASVSYASKGIGDISIQAKHGSILTKTYSIEDCTWAKVEEFESVQGGTAKSYNFTETALDLSSDFEFSVDMKTSSFGNSESRLFLANAYNGTLQPSYGAWVDYRQPGIGIGFRENGSTTGVNISSQSSTTNEYHHFELKKQGNSFTFKYDDRTAPSVTKSWWNNYTYYVTFIQWANTTIHMKNLKIKPL